MLQYRIVPVEMAEFGDFCFQRFPLIIAQIIDQDEKNFFAFFKKGKYTAGDY